MRFFLCLLIAGGILSATLGSACGKKEIIVVDPPMGGDTTMVIDTVRKPKLITLDPSWKKIDSLWKKVPDWVEVYERPDSNFGYASYVVVFDPKSTQSDWRVQTANPLTSLGNFWQNETGNKIACINATFFGLPNQNFGLVISDAALVSPNIRKVARTFQSVSTPYFPTRAALGTDIAGNASVFWTYSPFNSTETYAYPAPAENREGQAPLDTPSIGFPLNAMLWKPQQAVGGSPVLLRSGQVNITDLAELITTSASPTTSRPRSAMGITDKGHLVLLAVQAPNNKGVSLAGLASLLKSMGVTDAINLDGGGSTGMIVAGTTLVRSADATDRPIVSAIFLKNK